MSYQKCPLCEGLGTVPPPPGLTNCSQEQCSVCHGARIISELTGLPPMGEVHVPFVRTDKLPVHRVTTTDQGFSADSLHSPELMDGYFEWVHSEKSPTPPPTPRKYF